MANNIVSKHVLDIEALLSTKIDEKSWKANRELLKKGIENLKPLFDTESAEVNAKKLAEIFNKAFTKASMPEIGFEDIINNIDAMTSKFEEALGKINNIDTSALGNIERVINSIGETTNKIFDKLDSGVQTAGNNIKKNANIITKSISEIKTAAAKLDNESLNSIQETLNYNGKDTKGKQLKDIESLMAERTAVDAQGNHTFNQLPWEEQYKWFVKYTAAYQNYQKIAPKKDFEDLPETYKKAYNEALPRSFEARDMLQNIINVSQGKELIGYDKGEPWARESTLKEVLGVLKGGTNIEINDGVNNTQNLESSEQKNKEKTVTKKPKNQDGSYIVYRGVSPPEEDDNRTRKEIISDSGGAEYWTSDKKTARSYIDGYEDESYILQGKISPKNPLIIDAGGNSFKQFDEMKELMEKFPELQQMIKKNRNHYDSCS